MPLRRFYGLLNTMNYVLILAGPIVVALAAFTTYASMVRIGAVSLHSALGPRPPWHRRHEPGGSPSARLCIQLRLRLVSCLKGPAAGTSESATCCCAFRTLLIVYDAIWQQTF